MNPYAYVRNNPVKYTDPSGELPKFAWSRIADGLDMVGYNITADLLRVSVQSRISELGGVQYFYEGSSVTDEIHKSDVYREDVLGVIQANIDSGQINGIFYGEDVEFNEGDLGKAFHGMKGVFGKL